jgi:hypothetical protein
MIKTKQMGRFGNRLLIDVGTSIIAEHTNYKVRGYSHQEANQLDVSLYDGSDRYSHKFLTVEDDDIVKFLERGDLKELQCGVNLACSFQRKNFLLQYEEHIRKHFYYKTPPQSINSLLVHVRLGDVSHLNPGYKYYEQCIEEIDFVEGYITSDSPHSNLVKRLAEMYQLTLVHKTEPEILKYATGFDKLVLSNGTFSWWMGFLSQASTVYFPSMEAKWHGDIFVYPRWQGIKV